MKRFLRMITLLGVLFIIGSCSSSKSVNTSEVTGSVQYVVFEDYSLNSYDVVGIEITGGDYSAKTVYTGDQLVIESGVAYDIPWLWIEGTSLKSSSKLDYVFNSDYGTQTIHLGTGTYSTIFY